MSILNVRDRVSVILQESEDEIVPIYASGIVPEEWVENLSQTGTLPGTWLTSQEEARKHERRFIWPELRGDVSVMIVAHTKRSNLNGFPQMLGKVVHLVKPSVTIVQIASQGKNLRPDLQGKTVTSMKSVKEPTDIDAL